MTDSSQSGKGSAAANDRTADRVFWRSRRGLLELDLLLVPFAEQGFASLPAEQQALYGEMLDFEDVEIYAWIAGRESPPERFEDVLQAVRSFHQLA